MIILKMRVMKTRRKVQFRIENQNDQIEEKVSLSDNESENESTESEINGIWR
jgi:hypothetical protein